MFSTKWSFERSKVLRSGAVRAVDYTNTCGAVLVLPDSFGAVCGCDKTFGMQRGREILDRAVKTAAVKIRQLPLAFISNVPERIPSFFEQHT